MVVTVPYMYSLQLLLHDGNSIIKIYAGLDITHCGGSAGDYIKHQLLINHEPEKSFLIFRL